RGHLLVVQFLLQRARELNMELSEFDLQIACRGGHLPVVRFLHAQGRARLTMHGLEYAVETGRDDVVRYMLLSLTLGRQEQYRMSALAGSYGRLAVAQELHAAGVLDRRACLEAAAARGH